MTIKGRAISPLNIFVIAFVSVVVCGTLWYEAKFYPPSLVSHEDSFGIGNTVSSALKDYGGLPDFSLTESHGRTFTKKDLLGKIWIANFIYAQCTGPCPLLTEKMGKLKMQLPADIHFASFSVDPQHDTPQKLRDFASMHGVKSGNRWFFVTGDKPKMYQLIRSGFTLAVSDNAKKEFGAKDDIIHTTRFALIDKNGKIRGYYNGADENELKQLRDDVKKLTEKKS